MVSMIRFIANPPRVVIELPGREPYTVEDYSTAYWLAMQACEAVNSFSKERVSGQSKS